MKNLLLFIVCLLPVGVMAQSSGNVNYLQRSTNQFNLIVPEKSHFTSNNELDLKVIGLNNLKTDAYVAIFGLRQAGQTVQEVDELMNSRINKIKNSIVGNYGGVGFYVDMVSFVPVFEYDVEKKLFSKTYNEKPTGFELKKNLHIKYTKPEQLDSFVSICAGAEVYELVKVDYVVNGLESEKQKLVEKAQLLMQAKQAKFKALLNADWDTYDKQLVESFSVYNPADRYESYSAFSTTAIQAKQGVDKVSLTKPTIEYYNSVSNHEVDFVFNPLIVEPVVQVVYELRLKLVPKPKTDKAAEYYLISPGGELKKIEVGQ